jgi:hypothetical protein
MKEQLKTAAMVIAVIGIAIGVGRPPGVWRLCRLQDQGRLPK